MYQVCIRINHCQWHLAVIFIRFNQHSHCFQPLADFRSGEHHPRNVICTTLPYATGGAKRKFNHGLGSHITVFSWPNYHNEQ